MAKSPPQKTGPREGEILAPDDPEIKKAVQHVVAEMYAGPLPKASEFAAYERVQKGAADRIIKMAEQALGTEVFAVRADKLTEFIAMLLSRAFLYVLLGCAVYLAMNDKPVEAILAGLAPIVSVLYSTFKPSEQQPSKRKKKR